MNTDWEALIGGLGVGLRIEYSTMIFIIVLVSRVIDGWAGVIHAKMPVPRVSNSWCGIGASEILFKKAARRPPEKSML